MTVHCWGEQAAGKWTLKIQDTLSYERGETKPGLTIFFFSILTVGSEITDKTACRNEKTNIFLVLGVLEKWSLVMFGTAELPYSSAHRLRTRAAEIPAASDVTEEYNGRSHSPTNACVNNVAIGLSFCHEGAVTLPLQDPATQNAARMDVMGQARSSVSHACTFFSSSRTTQG